MAMVCEHLSALEHDLLERGIEVTYRGQAWSDNCREWVYFSCRLDLTALRARFAFPPSVEDHIHRGTHDGAEAGFVCTICHDGVMGGHPDVAVHWPVYS